MRRAPRYDALKFVFVFGYPADFRQLGFDDFRFSHVFQYEGHAFFALHFLYMASRRHAFALVLTIATGIAAEVPESSFDVASIKASSPGGLGSALGGLHHGTFTATNVNLKQLLSAGYGISQPRVVGPEWLDKVRFDVIAKSPSGVPDTQLEPMLQTLLKDRFKLAAHPEMRAMSVYYLNLARDGVKMPLYPTPDRAHAHPADDPHVRGFPMLRGTFTADQLADTIAGMLNRPVIDRTGLQERYSVFLSYAPLSPQGGDAPEFGPPDIFTAVEKQLGLRLQAGKESVEVVVVDHMEQAPTDN